MVVKNELKLVAAAKGRAKGGILSRAAFSGVMNFGWLVLFHEMAIC